MFWARVRTRAPSLGCDYCKNDIATAAEKAGLKSVTVHAIDNRTKLPKVYVWYKGQRSIKEPQNDK